MFWSSAIFQCADLLSNFFEAAAMALVDFDTISLSGAVALLDYVASVEQQDAQAWPDFVDDAGKCHDWHYFFLNNLKAALIHGTTA